MPSSGQQRATMNHSILLIALGLLMLAGPPGTVAAEPSGAFGVAEPATQPSAADPPRYRIADVQTKVLAAGPGRFFGRCALEELPDGTWLLVYHESGHHWRYEPA